MAQEIFEHWTTIQPTHESGEKDPEAALVADAYEIRKKTARQVLIWLTRNLIPNCVNRILAHAEIKARLLEQQLILKEAEAERAHIQSLTDPLTGLENRRGFEKAFMQRLAYAHRLYCSAKYDETLVLLAFDLDDFKKINDQYGHRVGDEMLKCFATFLREQVARRPEDHVARPGGDEFLVLWEDVNLEKLTDLEDFLRDKLSKLRFFYKNVLIPIRTSVGIRIIPAENDQSQDALLADADLALYAAKKKDGENCMSIWPPELETEEEFALPS